MKWTTTSFPSQVPEFPSGAGVTELSPMVLILANFWLTMSYCLKVNNRDLVVWLLAESVLYLKGQSGQTLQNFLCLVSSEDLHGGCSQPFTKSPRYQLSLSSSQNPLMERPEPCGLDTLPVVWPCLDPSESFCLAQSQSWCRCWLDHFCLGHDSNCASGQPYSLEQTCSYQDPQMRTDVL